MCTIQQPVLANFDTTEHQAAVRILDRAEEYAKMNGVEINRLALYMDIQATHAQSPIRLQELADAGDGDFAHDVFGILRHLDRKSGQLSDGFLPRYCVQN